MIRNNKNGFGNDSFCRILTTAEETISTVPDPDEYTEVSKAGNSGSNHTCYLMGGAIPVKNAVNNKFGTNCWEFDVDNKTSYIRVSTTKNDDWKFERNDYTIDFWGKFTKNAAPDASTQCILFSLYEDASNYQVLYLDYDRGDNLNYKIVEAGIEKVSIITASVNYTDQPMAHVAVVRKRNGFYLFVKGVLVGSDAYSGSLRELTSPFYIGNFTRSSVYVDNVYIDEFRLSKGIARWDKDFVVPDREY